MSIFLIQLLNEFIPNIYLSLLLIVLIPLSFIVTYQLFRIVKFEIDYSQLIKKQQLELELDEFFALLSSLISKRSWFESICLLEFGITTKPKNLYRYFNALGFVYYKIKSYNLAQTYYLKAVSEKGDYIVALQNLAKVYTCMNNSHLAINTYRLILNYDPNNKVAKQNLGK